MSTTKIEWTRDINGNPGKTWNPITGCTPISEGCEHCYARRMAQRLKGRYGYPEDDPFRVTFHPDRLDQPLKWKKPRMVFVCSMGDLFHEDVKDEWIDSIFSTMISTYYGYHTYLILTKRPQRMKAYLSRRKYTGKHSFRIWLGVTCENQQRADERIPILLQIPAAVRFVSIEPMLGPVDLTFINPFDDFHTDALDTPDPSYKLHWVILGGETGPGARPMHPDWARSVRDQCQAAGVPFFFKQWGEWIDATHLETTRSHLGIRKDEMMLENSCMRRIGKHKAGRLLDGREWNEYPK